MRAPIGTRIEDTAPVSTWSTGASAGSSRPQIATIVDNIGLPVSGINQAYNSSGTIGPQDGDIRSR